MATSTVGQSRQGPSPSRRGWTVHWTTTAQHHREWVTSAEIAEEERRKEAERRRIERERLERLEKARVGRLLVQAQALSEAQEIREYVSAVRDRQGALDDPLTEAGFQDWADWALTRQIELTQSSLAASGPFAWTTERPTALILEAADDGC